MASVQLANEDKRTFRKKEHKLVYRAFLDTLESLEEQAQQWIEGIGRKLQEKLLKG